jgi:glycosyltransferase involved in cell wall biosynthesis
MLTPYGDVDGLAAALARLMDEPDYRRSLGARGRQRLLDHFTWPEVAAQYAALYGRYASDLDRPQATGDQFGTLAPCSRRKIDSA